MKKTIFLTFLLISLSLSACFMSVNRPLKEGTGISDVLASQNISKEKLQDALTILSGTDRNIEDYSFYTYIEKRDVNMAGKKAKANIRFQYVSDGENLVLVFPPEVSFKDTSSMDFELVSDIDSMTSCNMVTFSMNVKAHINDDGKDTYTYETLKFEIQVM